MGKTKLDKKEIMQRYKAGESVSSMAKEFNTSREGIYKVLRKFSYYKQMYERLQKDRKNEHKSKYSMYDNDIPILRKDGFSVTQISEALSIPRKYVADLIAGTELDSSWKAKKKRNKKIFKMYKRGVKQSEIAKKFNTTQSNISNILYRHYKDKL